MSLAERLKQAREAAALSQEELAASAGVSQSLIAQLESSKIDGSKKIVEISVALGVDARWLALGVKRPAASKKELAVGKESA